MAFVVEKYQLAYFPVPKIACTSLKQMFYLLQNGSDFEPRSAMHGNLRNIHVGPFRTRSFYDKDGVDLSQAFRIAVVRDPLDRLYSAYANRVITHKELSEQALAKTKASAIGLRPDPDFMSFVNDLDGYRLVSPSIRHHTDPMTYFLGPSCDYYHKVYRINQLDQLVADVRQQTGVMCALPHEQRAPKGVSRPDLSSAAFDRLREFYSGDYALLEQLRLRGE